MTTHDSDEPSQPTVDETALPSTRANATGVQVNRIGPYKILGRLGEGGFGVVYSAQQTEPRRRVALKVIKPGMDSRAVIARFEAERQALALMDHPHVAKVFDAGTTEQGRPYFAMEYVAGIPITEHCDKHRLGIEERLELFMQVCGAVQHAHQKGIIHRDLKPSNILVEFKDGQSVPKVIDFGVAKAIDHRLTEKTVFTEQGQLIGTPAYMSPEQAEMTTQDIDTRSDIYSLGVLLYELLTGSLPFDPKSLLRGAFDEIRRIIREVEPPKPSTKLSSMITAGGDDSTGTARNRRADPRSLTRQLRGDLDWITMKALEKDRTRRYPSASDFAADLRRHLNHEPVVAGPPGTAYRVKKFVRRNRAMVTTAAVVFVVLAAGVAGITWQAVVATHQRDRANAAREEADQARDQLQVVTDFQSSMLSEIDAEAMGRGIFDDLRDGIRESLNAETMTPETIAAAIAAFDTSLKRVNPTDLALKVVDENVLSRAVETIEKKFADQPLVRAALQQTVAATYRQIGLYPPAMPLQEAALQTRRKELGDDHPDTLRSINSMGLLLGTMGKLAEAEPYHRGALEGYRRVLGDDHPETLTSIDNMGALLQLMGKFAEAEPYYREALEGRRHVLGDDHSDTLTSINNMGYLLQSMGKLSEAEPYYREALEGRRRVLGDDHPHTLSSINNMGLLLELMGRLAEAEPYWREALDGFRRVLGDDHPHTLSSINNMGLLLLVMGKLAEAEPYFREALEGRRRVQGNDHPDTLISINNMGYLLQEMGKLAEAEPYYRDALETSRRVLGDDHPDTLGSIHNMGGLLRDLGRLEEAEALGAEAVRGARRSLPDGHWHTAVFLTGHGKTLTKLKRFADAEAALREAHGIFETALGPEHKRTIKVIQSLVDLYDAWSKPGEAAAWRARLPGEESDEGTGDKR